MNDLLPVAEGSPLFWLEKAKALSTSNDQNSASLVTKLNEIFAYLYKNAGGNDQFEGSCEQFKLMINVPGNLITLYTLIHCTKNHVEDMRMTQLSCINAMLGYFCPHFCGQPEQLMSISEFVDPMARDILLIYSSYLDEEGKCTILESILKHFDRTLNWSPMQLKSIANHVEPMALETMLRYAELSGVNIERRKECLKAIFNHFYNGCSMLAFQLESIAKSDNPLALEALLQYAKITDASYYCLMAIFAARCQDFQYNDTLEIVDEKNPSDNRIIIASHNDPIVKEALRVFLLNRENMKNMENVD
jgi:hypothetical protein